MAEVGERELLEACREGRVLECSGAGGRRGVPGALLRRCCGELKDEVDPRGVRVRGAVVSGCLDLSGMDVPFPLLLEGCELDSAVAAEGAVLHGLALTRCRFPGLLANGVRVHRDLDVSGSTVTGAHWTTASSTKRSAVWLCESQVGGRLLCVDTVIRSDGERAVQADLMHSGGTVRLVGQFTARGEVRLLGARIDGSLDLNGARMQSPTGLALDASEAVIGGSMFLIDDVSGRRPVIRGRIDLGGTRIAGQVFIRNATLQEQGPVPDNVGYTRSWVGGAAAVSAPRLSAGAEMTIEGHTDVSGGVDLSMSDLADLRIGGNCTLRAPGKTALDLTNADIRASVDLRAGATVQGTIRLPNARIRGSLSLAGARLSHPERSSLVAAQRAAIDGDVMLQGLRAGEGRLRLDGATVGSVIAAGAELDNPGGLTLSLQQAVVKGSVILAEGFRSVGLVVLSGSAVAGRAELDGGTFTCPAPSGRNQAGHAIEAISAAIGGGMELGHADISPSADFTNATTTFLADDPRHWPPRFVISGFTYDRFEHPRNSAPGPTWDAAARIAWLTSQAAYDAGPYEQAARVFRQHGHAPGAEQILIAGRKHARKTSRSRTAPHRRLLDVLYDASVGYGYHPERALWLIAALLILVTGSLEIPAAQATLRATPSSGVIYTTQGPLPSARTGTAPHGDACGNGTVRCFSPVFYALDTVLPLISLNQRSTWYPDPRTRYGLLMEWWLNTATILGWLLSSIFVLSFARLARAK
jgi:hypothetical protein